MSEPVDTSNEALREQAHALVDRLADHTDWQSVVSSLEQLEAEARWIEAQELDPHSPVRQALTQGLRELDEGRGIADEALSRALKSRA